MKKAIDGTHNRLAKKVGIRAYAEAVGKSESSMRESSFAAKVYLSLPRSSVEVIDKTKHLYEISKADSQQWRVIQGIFTSKQRLFLLMIWVIYEQNQNEPTAPP